MTSPALQVRLFPYAKAASLVAALALVAQSEWALALAVGWPAWIAWAAPLALDSYVLAAISAKRDLGPSVVVSAASVFGSHAVYAAGNAWESGTAAEGHLVWQLAAACSVVPLLVTWRVHHLRLADVEPPVVIAVESAAVPLERPDVPPASLPAERPASNPIPVAAPAPLMNATDKKVWDALAAGPLGMSAIRDSAELALSTTKVAVARMLERQQLVKDGTKYKRRMAA